MKKYDVECLITVTRKFADPSRGSKTFSDKSVKTVEAENEEEALEKGFEEGVKELTGIAGTTPDIDKENMKFSVLYANGSSVHYTDFKVINAE